jgi:hypothetical protein
LYDKEPMCCVISSCLETFLEEKKKRKRTGEGRIERKEEEEDEVFIDHLK